MSNVFNNLSQKSAFWAGLIFGFLLMCSIGFVITMALWLFGGGLSSGSVKNIADPVTPPGSPEAAGLQAGDEIDLATITGKDHIRGSIDAAVTIVEFSDTECPFCKRFHSTMKQVVDEYDGRVRWAYKHFPLDSLHRKARKEAEATECAAALGGNDAFWKYLDRLFEITPSNDSLSVDELPDIAEYAGLDRSDFEDCLESGKYSSIVQGHLLEGQKAGARGTPYSVIVAGDRTIPVSGATSFERLRSIIDPLLK